MTIEEDHQLLNKLGEMFASELDKHPSDDEFAAFRAVLVAQPELALEEDEGAGAAAVIPFARPARRWEFG